VVTVVLIVDRSALAEQLTAELRSAGLSVKLPSRSEARLALEQPLTLCVADRAARDDRGVELLRATRAAGLDIPFVFIDPEHAASEPPPWQGRGVWVHEPLDMATLTEFVRGTARRLVNAPAALLGQPSMRIGDVVLDCGRLDVLVAGRRAMLTPVQFAFLYYLARHNDRFHSTDELSQALWGRSRVPGEKNIAQVVRHLRRRLRAVAPTLTVIESKHGVGYRFALPEPGNGGLVQISEHPGPATHGSEV
jgi:DNA-binding response OmpR family regulator